LESENRLKTKDDLQWAKTYKPEKVDAILNNQLRLLDHNYSEDLKLIKKLVRNGVGIMEM
jgi:hypothetical protein